MESINEVIFAAVSLIFLLLGVVLLVSILFSAFNPYDQIAFANTEKLKATIDQACLTNSDVELRSFELRQNKPAFAWLFTILPRWMIRMSGDPNYVLYYESFPAPEAIGWEVYHNFQNRLIVPLPEGWEGKTSENVDNFVKDVIRNYKDRNPGSPLDAVIINNIVLSEAFRSDYILSTEPRRDIGIGEEEFGGIGGAVSEKKGGFFGYGKWKKQDDKSKIPLAGNNQFVFTNYLGLTEIEKTSIKYQACGENALCLKTKSGVYKFPLTYCNDIKAIQLAYNGLSDENALRESAATGGAILAGIGAATGSLKTALAGAGLAVFGMKEIVKRHIALKFADFNVVSPCLIKDDDPADDLEIKVKYAPCNNKVTFQEISDAVHRDVEYTPCTNAISYPLYEYDATEEGKLRKIDGKDHYTCIESVGNRTDEIGDTATGFTAADQCIQVYIEKIKGDYCWTPNPYKKADGFWDRLISISLIRESFLFLFNPPIRDNTAYIADISTEASNAPAIVLLPTQTAQQKGDSFFESLRKKWGWRWP